MDILGSHAFKKGENDLRKSKEVFADGVTFALRFGRYLG